MKKIKILFVLYISLAFVLKLFSMSELELEEDAKIIAAKFMATYHYLTINKEKFEKQIKEAIAIIKEKHPKIQMIRPQKNAPFECFPLYCAKNDISLSINKCHSIYGEILNFDIYDEDCLYHIMFDPRSKDTIGYMNCITYKQIIHDFNDPHDSKEDEDIFENPINYCHIS